MFAKLHGNPPEAGFWRFFALPEAAQRLALPAWGGRVDSLSKRESAKARKMPKKRGAYPKSGHAVLGGVLIMTDSLGREGVATDLA